MPKVHRPIPAVVAEKAISNVTKLPNGCWETNFHTGQLGYGSISYRDPATKKDTSYLAHRASWTAANGPIPVGLVIDHRCFNRKCVNPDHLRPLTLRENTQRKNGRDFPTGQCPWGHDASAMRLYHWGKVPAQWGCSACVKEKNDARAKIDAALRQLEIAFGVGDWHTKRNYRHTIHVRNQRVLAHRAARLGIPASNTGSEQP